MNRLEPRLLAAHAAQNTAALVDLYTEAANTALSQDATGFYLTHAYVFALEIAHPNAGDLRARLVQSGRESD